MREAKRVGLVLVSMLIASACTWLGFWQISRLHEKQAYNAGIASRRFMPAAAFDSVPRDTIMSKFRRVRLEGKFDYANQIVWTLRGRDGSPGVNILTPLRRPGNDTALLVNRGWVYSPDATDVDLARWSEPDSFRGEAYLLPLHVNVLPAPETRNKRSFRDLDLKVLEKIFPYPLSPVFAVLSSPPVDSINAPPRVTLLPLDEGSHLSYAFQWFSFAVISIIGAAIFSRKT